MGVIDMAVYRAGRPWYGNGHVRSLVQKAAWQLQYAYYFQTTSCWLCARVHSMSKPEGKQNIYETFLSAQKGW